MTDDGMRKDVYNPSQAKYSPIFSPKYFLEKEENKTYWEDHRASFFLFALNLRMGWKKWKGTEVTWGTGDLSTRNQQLVFSEMNHIPLESHIHTCPGCSCKVAAGRNPALTASWKKCHTFWHLYQTNMKNISAFHECHSTQPTEKHTFLKLAYLHKTHKFGGMYTDIYGRTKMHS